MVGGFKSVKDVAEDWSLTTRTVRNMCANGKIKNAEKIGRDWLIPIDAERPPDGRVKTGNYKNWRKEGA